MDLSKLRREYGDAQPPFDCPHEDPLKQFEDWFRQACEAGLPEPNAMVLATIDHDAPTQRTVLLKYFDRQGFVFFTNYGSRKAEHIAHNTNVCLLFPWYPLQRQVEINGRAEKTTTVESLKYFATRPRGAQLGAWASPQSSVVKSPAFFETKLAELRHKFADGEIAWPTFWGGYRVIPQRFEFWQGRENRLHDRYRYLLQENGWTAERLAP